MLVKRREANEMTTTCAMLFPVASGTLANFPNSVTLPELWTHYLHNATDFGGPTPCAFWCWWVLTEQQWRGKVGKGG